MFRRYFFTCAVSVLTGVMVLGVILFGFAADMFERNKYHMMERFVRRAAGITAENYVKNNKAYVEKNLITLTYSVVSQTIEADVFLTDPSGRMLYYIVRGAAGTETPYQPKEAKMISGHAVRSAIDDGIYEETGTLLDFFDGPQYIVGIPVTAEGTAFGVLFAACPADDLTEFTRELVKMFALGTLGVLVLVLGVIYFITAKLVEPLKNMLDATHSYARGDFSKRVPVSSYGEIGQLSMAFNNMASTLASTEGSRRSFIANVSHELKTPMTTISGFVDGVLDGTIPEEKRDQYLTVVSEECKRLSRLVRSMLDTARLEAGELEIRPIRFDISEIIRQTIFTFEHVIEEKRLEIRGLEIDRVIVYADKDLMHQVVYNLIENAVKFVDREGYIEVFYTMDEKMTYVTIRNSGAGISKDEVPQLFERFYKSDRSRGLNKDGIGLGLHIVKSIINYHKGDITVRSIQGEYTEFEFSIPHRPEAGSNTRGSTD